MIVKLVSWRVGDLVNGKALHLPTTNSRTRQLRDHACGEVAQLVEHTTENRGVDSSILSLATNFSNNLEGFEKRQSGSRSRLTNG